MMQKGSRAAEFARPLLVVAAAIVLAGCSTSDSGLSTGSLFGSSEKKTKSAASAYRNDPTARALQVGSTSARAVKCGYNFDPAKLRASFLSSEAALGAPVAQLSGIEKTYDIAYNGVTKAVTSNNAYCTAAKTQKIKADLTRHLAGDFTPTKQKVVAVKPADNGIFGGLLDSDSVDDGPKTGSDEWWEKQQKAVGQQ